MTAFRFRAAREDGEQVSGVLNAPTAAAALADLTGRGLFALAVREDGSAASRTARLPRSELADAFAGLAALLEAGVPADRALAEAEELSGRRVSPLFAEARRRVREGTSLSAALDAAGGLPPMAIGLLRAGEAHGRIAAATRRLAEELEREAELRARVRAALAYPVFLAVVGTASVGLIVGLVVPRFAGLLSDLGQTLPPATRALIAVSRAVAAHGLLIAGVVAIGAILGARAAATGEGALALHRFLLDLPIIGPLRRRLASARACRALAGLLESGVPLLAALDLARGAAGDRAIAERLAQVREAVSQGERLGAALRRHDALAPAALRLATFGERSGRLAELVAQAARLEEAGADRALRALVGLLEPALIVGFGALVAFVAAALLQAVYSVRPAGF